MATKSTGIHPSAVGCVSALCRKNAVAVRTSRHGRRLRGIGKKGAPAGCCFELAAPPASTAFTVPTAATFCDIFAEGFCIRATFCAALRFPRENTTDRGCEWEGYEWGGVSAGCLKVCVPVNFVCTREECENLF